MKMWKKFAAAFLLSALVLTLLTACDSAPQVPGEMTKDVHKVVQWANESAAECGLHMEEDDSIYEALRLQVEYEAAMEKAEAAGDLELMKQLSAAFDEKWTALWNGRQYALMSFGADSKTHLFEENTVKDTTRSAWRTMPSELSFTPTKIGGVIRTDSDGSLSVTIVITE